MNFDILFLLIDALSIHISSNTSSFRLSTLCVGPTGITFFNSNKMGFQYENGIFVGDIINGNIYHFRLAPNRTELILPTGPIEDRVVKSSDTLDGIIFGRGFGGITDIKVGPDDGYLYVLTFDSSQGTIFRIVPKGPM